MEMNVMEFSGNAIFSNGILQIAMEYLVSIFIQRFLLIFI